MGALHGVARSAGGARLLLTPLPTRFLPADAVSIKGSLSVSFTPTHVLSPYHPFSLSSSSRSLSLSHCPSDPCRACACVVLSLPSCTTNLLDSRGTFFTLVSFLSAPPTRHLLPFLPLFVILQIVSHLHFTV